MDKNALKKTAYTVFSLALILWLLDVPDYIQEIKTGSESYKPSGSYAFLDFGMAQLNPSTSEITMAVKNQAPDPVILDSLNIECRGSCICESTTKVPVDLQPKKTFNVEGRCAKAPTDSVYVLDVTLVGRVSERTLSMGSVYERANSLSRIGVSEEKIQDMIEAHQKGLSGSSSPVKSFKHSFQVTGTYS